MPMGFFRLCTSPRNNTLFVTDGGIYENLGLGPLLARRCRVMFVVDAGADPHCNATELLELFQRSRARHGIRIEPLKMTGNEAARRWIDDLVSDRKPAPADGKGNAPEAYRQFPKSRQHFIVFKVTYPPKTRHTEQVSPLLTGRDDKDHGYIVYIKPTFDGDEKMDLCGFALHNGDYPNDSTVNQFYEPEQFDAYRELGRHIGFQVSKKFLINGRLCVGKWKSQGQVPVPADWASPPGPVDIDLVAIDADRLLKTQEWNADRQLESKEVAQRVMSWLDEHSEAQGPWPARLVGILKRFQESDDLEAVGEIMEAVKAFGRESLMPLAETIRDSSSSANGRRLCLDALLDLTADAPVADREVIEALEASLSTIEDADGRKIVLYLIANVGQRDRELLREVFQSVASSATLPDECRAEASMLRGRMGRGWARFGEWVSDSLREQIRA
jgi:hypothetical protein